MDCFENKNSLYLLRRLMEWIGSFEENDNIENYDLEGYQSGLVLNLDHALLREFFKAMGFSVSPLDNKSLKPLEAIKLKLTSKVGESKTAWFTYNDQQFYQFKDESPDFMALSSGESLEKCLLQFGKLKGIQDFYELSKHIPTNDNFYLKDYTNYIWLEPDDLAKLCLWNRTEFKQDFQKFLNTYRKRKNETLITRVAQKKSKRVYAYEATSLLRFFDSMTKDKSSHVNVVNHSEALPSQSEEANSKIEELAWKEVEEIDVNKGDQGNKEGTNIDDIDEDAKYLQTLLGPESSHDWCYFALRIDQFLKKAPPNKNLDKREIIALIESINKSGDISQF